MEPCVTMVGILSCTSRRSTLPERVVCAYWWRGHRRVWTWDTSLPPGQVVLGSDTQREALNAEANLTLWKVYSVGDMLGEPSTRTPLA